MFFIMALYIFLIVFPSYIWATFCMMSWGWDLKNWQVSDILHRLESSRLVVVFCVRTGRTTDAPWIRDEGGGLLLTAKATASHVVALGRQVPLLQGGGGWPVRAALAAVMCYRRGRSNRRDRSFTKAAGAPAQSPFQRERDLIFIVFGGKQISPRRERNISGFITLEYLHGEMSHNLSRGDPVLNLILTYPKCK